ncbi:MAG: glycosyltransferase family 4 protein [Dehalococcoidia bacterium]|nr:glycosyltransferase family 4 protein [Dehalococcoidia bacterium]MCB9486034.1 glycosyltransferase family 4 protein [Thermoflexaceae bacterium]
MTTRTRPKATFVGVTYAGWQTRQMNLARSVAADGRLDAAFHEVTGWRPGGLIERLPLPASIRGRLRAMEQARPLAAVPRPDIVWTSATELALPYLWAFLGPLDRPLVVETDWTVDQQESMAQAYYGRPGRTGLSLRIARWRERRFLNRVDMFSPMSNWAADDLRRLGVPDERIRVIHPGVDLDAWKPGCRVRSGERPLRLLFVGGNFQRKGGDLLLDAMRGAFLGRCELDIVTRDPVPEAPGVRVHRAEPNSPELRELYERADLFVMPTRAECFGQVAVEALASGLPVIVGKVGGTGDIVDDGATGWRIQPDAPSLHAALEHALSVRECLPLMGARGRAVAEERFDGHRNDTLLIDLMIELVEQRKARHGTG